MKSHATVLLFLGSLLPGASLAETVTPSGEVGEEPDPHPLKQRSSFEMRLASRPSASNGFRVDGLGVATHTPAERVSFGLGFSHWLKEDLAVTFAATAEAGEWELTWDAERREFVDSRGLVSLLVGVRKYVGGTPKLRPYLAAAVGPYIGGRSATANRASGRARTESRTMVTVGGHVGGGVAFLLGRSWILDVGGGYNVMADFPKTVGGHYDYNGFELGIGVSWLFGGGEVEAKVPLKSRTGSR